MSTYFTVWHYLSVIIITAAFISAVVFTVRNKNLPAKGSMIVIYLIAALVLEFMIILAIDQYTKKVTLMNVENHRFLPTEKIIFTGIVRNTGKYTIGEVTVEIKIVNREDNNHYRSDDPRYKSTAFEEVYKTKNSDQSSFLVITEVVATDLKPGQSKPFYIRMPYPPHFKGFSDYIRVSGH